MTTRRHNRLGLLWVAFAAIGGMLSVGDAAKACAEVKAAAACCEASPSANCRCCGSSDTSVPSSGVTQWRDIERSLPSTRPGIDVNRPGSSCECRSNAPDAPARRPDSRSSDEGEGRADRGHDEVIAYLDFAPRPSVAAFRLVSCNVSPPKSPLYLRTLRLLV